MVRGFSSSADDRAGSEEPRVSAAIAARVSRFMSRCIKVCSLEGDRAVGCGPEVISGAVGECPPFTRSGGGASRVRRALGVLRWAVFPRHIRGIPLVIPRRGDERLEKNSKLTSKTALPGRPCPAASSVLWTSIDRPRTRHPLSEKDLVMATTNALDLLILPMLQWTGGIYAVMAAIRLVQLGLDRVFRGFEPRSEVVSLRRSSSVFADRPASSRSARPPARAWSLSR